jgi:predicted phage baseplate assembly protein
MNDQVNPTRDDCGCCEGLNAETPLKVYNRPGLKAISYRVGTHASFKQSMLVHLSGSKRPELQKLNTRENDDFSIALLDAWAMIADVLTFYQERIANESYLRTATERMSLLHLSRLIGYELRPGVAASTYLSFTMKDIPSLPTEGLQIKAGIPNHTIIDTGTKVQSIPGSGEQSQIFETIEKIEADVRWNAMKPHQRRPHPSSSTINIFTIQGLTTNLKPGDSVLLVADNTPNPTVNRVKRLVPDKNTQTTCIELEEGSTVPPFVPPELKEQKPMIDELYLFSWGKVPGNDNGRLIEFLMQYFNIEWINAAKIEKNADVKTIMVTNDTNYLSLTLNNEKTNVNLEIDDGRTDIFIVKTENGELNIYDEFSDEINDEVVKEIINKAWKQEDLLALAATRKWSVEALEASINNLIVRPPDVPPLKVYALGIQSSLFGHNAPRWDSLPAGQRYGECVIDKWDNEGNPISYKYIDPIYPENENWDKEPFNLVTIYGENKIYLERTYSGIIEGNWLVLENAEKVRESYSVNKNVETTYNKFGLTARVTCLELNIPEDKTESLKNFKIRETTVLSQSEKIDLADLPLDTDVGGISMILDRAYLGLKSGMKAIINGERTDMKGTIASEVVTLDNVELLGGYTKLTFKHALIHTYVRDTVTINANVAGATHGETKQEVLGSGDASQTYQCFILRQPPLTFVISPTPSGAETTLEVRVNDLLWHEASTLYGHGPDERIYVSSTDNNGNTTIQFGDGKTGARLPTGQDNVRATYRQGIGVGGLIREGTLQLLMTRSLGVNDVINPFDASGAADRESLDDARHNAQLTILTLERIVSLQDYEDFARAYAGISKALATWIWVDQKRGIFITVAGPKGAPILPDSELYKNLIMSIQKTGDSSVPLRVESYQPASFRLTASLKIDPDRHEEAVLDAVKKALQTHFSFEMRSFGQSVTVSEVVQVMHSIQGVIAVDVDELCRTDEKRGDWTEQPLIASVPQARAETEAMAAELLTIDLNFLDLKVML